MGLFRSVKKIGAFGFNVKRWAGLKERKSNLQLIVALSKSAFNREEQKENKPKESFEAVLHRFNLDEKDLQHKIKVGKRTAAAFSVATLLLLCYAIYLFTLSQQLSGVICVLLSFTALLYGFKEHFSAYQLAQRSFNCTYKQWAQSLLKKGAQK